jgi:hypothetical protein
LAALLFALACARGPEPPTGGAAAGPLHDDDIVPVTVTYGVAGYRIECRVGGDLEGEFNILPTDGYPRQAGIAPGPHTIAMEPDGHVAFGDTWRFAAGDVDAGGRYLVRFTYHHGANSVTTWRSAVEYAHGGEKRGVEVNSFGPKAVTSGGNFTLEAKLPAALVPTGAAASPLGATGVDAHRNLGPIPMGDSYLRSVDVFKLKGATAAPWAKDFDEFFPGPVAVGAEVDILVEGAGLLEFGCDFRRDPAGHADVTFQNVTCKKESKIEKKTFYPAQAEIDAAGGKEAWANKKRGDIEVPLPSIPHMAVARERMADVGGGFRLVFVLM